MSPNSFVNFAGHARLAFHLSLLIRERDFHTFILKLYFRAQYLSEVRTIMGIPDWFLEVDSRKTQNLYENACIQILIHFRGPNAHHLEIVSNKYFRIYLFKILDALLNYSSSVTSKRWPYRNQKKNPYTRVI